MHDEVEELALLWGALLVMSYLVLVQFCKWPLFLRVNSIKSLLCFSSHFFGYFKQGFRVFPILLPKNKKIKWKVEWNPKKITSNAGKNSDRNCPL